MSEKMKMVSAINALMDEKETTSINVSDSDLFVNSSYNNEGEDKQVIEVCWNEGEIGCLVEDNDFYTFDELEDDEVERIYDVVMELF